MPFVQCMLVAAEFSQQDWGVVVWSLASIAEAEQDAVIYLEDLFISPAIEAQVQSLLCLERNKTRS